MKQLDHEQLTQKIYEDLLRMRESSEFVHALCPTKIGFLLDSLCILGKGISALIESRRPFDEKDAMLLVLLKRFASDCADILQS